MVLKVLYLEDSLQDVEIMQELLIEAGYNLKMESTAREKEFVSLLRSCEYDIILSDFKLPGFDAFAALKLSAEICPDVPFICVSGTVGEETAIELLRKGAVDYILKDRLIRLPSAIQRAIEESKEKKARLLAEAALFESEERFRTLFENSTVGIYRTTPTGKIMLANPALVNMLGYSTFEELSSRNLDETGFEPSYERAKFIEKIETNGAVLGLESAWTRTDGKIVFIRESAKVIRDKEGKNLYYDGIIEDITLRKQAEDEISKLNESLEYRVLERTAQLEAATREMESFTYSVSHDLRAPLRSIHSFGKILLAEYENKLDDEGKRICRIISSDAIKMGALIDDLLNFSRISTSKINPSLLDMRLIAKSSYDDTATENEKTRINLKFENLHKVHGDLHLIKIVWTNLISNAIKYSSKKKMSVILIGSQSEGESITYFIKDNGVGFDMEYKHKLYGVFQRLHSENEFAGNGVGLAIVHRIIQSHGGKVWAEGKVDEGATFYFSLPVKNKE